MTNITCDLKKCKSNSNGKCAKKKIEIKSFKEIGMGDIVQNCTEMEFDED